MRTISISDNPEMFKQIYAEQLSKRTGRPVEDIRQNLEDAFNMQNAGYVTIGDIEGAPDYVKMSYAPLFGARIKRGTVSEFDKSLMEFMGASQGLMRAAGGLNATVETFSALNSIIKQGKTVYSPITQVRNYMSNQLIAGANLHYSGVGSSANLLVDLINADKIGQPRKLLFGALTVGNENRQLNRDKYSFGSFEELYNEANTRGLIDSDVLSSEIRKAVLNEPIFEVNTNSGEKLQKSLAQGKGVLQANKIYRAGDGAYKLNGFLSEVKFFENPKNNLKQGDGYLNYRTGEVMSREEMLDFAAGEVRARYMTGTEMPKIVSTVGRNPFFGTFISFPCGNGKNYSYIIL